ncbi:MAG: hypothetical protein WC799_17505 [Desulfobacteraceae bacterium]|jgi:hypothetical protein
MIGFVHDVGELGRLVMAAEGRWIHQGDMGKDLADKRLIAFGGFLFFLSVLGLTLVRHSLQG